MSILTVASLSTIDDLAERARAADRLAAWYGEQAHRARLVRDASLREAFDGGASRPQLARRTGINISTVKAVTR